MRQIGYIMLMLTFTECLEVHNTAEGAQIRIPVGEKLTKSGNKTVLFATIRVAGKQQRDEASVLAALSRLPFCSPKMPSTGPMVSFHVRFPSEVTGEIGCLMACLYGHVAPPATISAAAQSKFLASAKCDKVPAGWTVADSAATEQPATEKKQRGKPAQLVS
jgi:hypothetical protein